MKEVVLTISVLLYFVSCVPYTIGILKGNIKPRPLSWLGWSMLLGVGISSQIIENGFNSSMLIAISACLFCFFVFMISLFKKALMNKEYDYICFVLGIICMVIYLISKDALITTVFAVCADLFVGIPTIINVYKNPRSEHLLAWGIGTFSIFLSFIIVLGEDGFLIKFYPSYLLFFNFLIFSLCFKRYITPYVGNDH